MKIYFTLSITNHSLPIFRFAQVVFWIVCIHSFSFSTVVRCKSLQAPKDGQVTPKSCETSPEYDTTCLFSCSKGYRLYGEPITTCSSDGQWSKNTTLFCKGWSQSDVHLCFFICKKLCTKERGKVKFNDPSVPVILESERKKS